MGFVKMKRWELFEKLRQFNEENGYKTKGTPTKLEGVIVYSEDSFDKKYSLEARSYLVSSDNKAFLPNQISNSIFGYALDGSDDGVRLDWYDNWKVDYCYLREV